MLFLPNIHWWRLLCDMGHCCGAASKCVQCLVAHVPPFSWVFQGLPDKKFDWQFVLVAQNPCGRSPDYKKNKWALNFIMDLLIIAFLGRGEIAVCHFRLWRFVSGSYPKNHDSSPVITLLKNSGFLSSGPEDQDTHPSDLSSAQSWGSLEPSWRTLFSCPNPVLKFDGR